MRRIVTALAAGLLGVTVVAATDTPDVGWQSYNGGSDEQRFADLDAIDTGNVAGLGLAWYADLGSSRGLETTPLVVGRTMYATLPWSKVVALDAVTGEEKWRFDPEVPGEFALSACCDVVNRGAAFENGRVFVGTIDGRLVALDAETGEKLWDTQTTDREKPYTITGAPRVAKGLVFIGNGGGEYGARGYVSAYDQQTGELRWRFWVVPGEPGKPDGAASDEVLEKLARETWFGDDYWRYGGGGTVWDSIVYDEELDRLYIGTGNGGPWNRVIRSEDKGDNLFLSSIVALDPDTGEYIWHYQQVPGETWDFTAAQQMTLADLEIDGRKRKVILHAPKNGFFYVIDRTDGSLISAEKFVPANWAERIDLETGRPVETEGARFRDKPFLATSGASGAHNWQPMSFDPRTGLVYIPAQQVPFLYTKDEKFRFEPDLWNLGVDMMSTPLPETPEERAAMKEAIQGRLIAWDPVAQKPVWKVEHEGTWHGGVLATSGDLVFQGLNDGTFQAYHAGTGKVLWRFNSKSPILPAPVSYRIDGKQYVAIAAGAGGGFALSLPSFEGPRTWPEGRILVFALGGDKTLPDTPQVRRGLTKVSQDFTPAQVEEGKALFGQVCAACHAMGTMSAGIVPDLKRSGVLASKEAWKAVVIDGVLASRGMAAFGDYMTPQQAEAIRAYVASRAHLEAARQMADK